MAQSWPWDNQIAVEKKKTLLESITELLGNWCSYNVNFSYSKQILQRELTKILQVITALKTCLFRTYSKAIKHQIKILDITIFIF